MRRIAIVIVLGWRLIHGQTKVDLQNQSRGIDFSAAPYTKPAKTGAALPSTCSTGEAFVWTAAVPGSNLYICITTNTWSLQGGSSSAGLQGPAGPQGTQGAPGPQGPIGPQGPPGSSSGTGGGASQSFQFVDWRTTRQSATQLQTGAMCLPATPCNVNIGGIVTQYTGGPYVFNLANSRSGTLYLYISNTGVPIAGYGSGLAAGDISVPAGTNAFTATPGADNYPQDALVLAKWNVTAGAFDATAATQQLGSYLSYSPKPINGTGILVSSDARPQISIDTLLVPRKYFCGGGPAAALPAGGAQGDTCVDFTTAPTVPVLYVCTNAAGCLVAADWKASSGGGGGAAVAQGATTFSSSGKWTLPTGVNRVFVEVWAGGGGGAAAYYTSKQGGAGGGYASGWCWTNPEAAAVTVTVGIGGSGGIVGGAGPTAGGNSSFGSCLTAVGGGLSMSAGYDAAFDTTTNDGLYFGNNNLYTRSVLLSGAIPYGIMWKPMRPDQGGTGGDSPNPNAVDGLPGGPSFYGGGGGGSGARNSTAGATQAGGSGGASAHGGAGGNGGGIVAGVLGACTAGTLPGGGGGSPGYEGSNHNGCDGAAGQVKIWY